MSTTFDQLADFFASDAFLVERETLMQQVTLAALAESQPRTPVRTGHLRRSETTRVADRGRQGFVGTNVEYAPFVHARVPFFQQGITNARPKIDDLLQQAGDRYLAKASTP